MKELKGEILFDIYASKPGDYGQTLMTAHINIGDKLFTMLEECERTGKKIVFVDNPEFEGCDDQPFNIEMV